MCTYISEVAARCVVALDPWWGFEISRMAKMAGQKSTTVHFKEPTYNCRSVIA